MRVQADHERAGSFDTAAGLSRPTWKRWISRGVLPVRVPINGRQRDYPTHERTLLLEAMAAGATAEQLAKITARIHAQRARTLALVDRALPAVAE